MSVQVLCEADVVWVVGELQLEEERKMPEALPWKSGPGVPLSALPLNECITLCYSFLHSLNQYFHVKE